MTPPVDENLSNSSVQKMSTSEIVVENEMNGHSYGAEAENSSSYNEINEFQPIPESESAMADEEVRCLNYPTTGPQSMPRYLPPFTPGQWNPEFNALMLSFYANAPAIYNQLVQQYVAGTMMNQWYVPLGYLFQNSGNYVTPPPLGALQDGSWCFGNPFSAFAPPQQNANYSSTVSQTGVSQNPPGFSSFQPYVKMAYPTPPETESDELEEIFPSNSITSSPPPLSPRSAYRASLNAEAPEFVPRYSSPRYPSAVEIHRIMPPPIPANPERMHAQSRPPIESVSQGPYQQFTGTTSTGLSYNAAPVSNDKGWAHSGNLNYENSTESEERTSQPHSFNAQQTYEGAKCAFCYRKGDRNYFHKLKDAKGEVVCPYLRLIRCYLCGATGAVAHTSRYCPKNPSKKGKPTGGGGASGTTSTSASSSRQADPSGAS